MFWKKKESDRVESQSWFSYTVLLPDREEEEQEVLIMGNYIIKNTGITTLNNPVICIRINPPHGIGLGGKIGSFTHTALMIDGSNSGAWEYIDNDWKEKSSESGEHWLKPAGISQLMSGESVAFANELRFSLSQKEKYINIEGFCYFDEIKNGTAALNKITMNF